MRSFLLALLLGTSTLSAQEVSDLRKLLPEAVPVVEEAGSLFVVAPDGARFRVLAGAGAGEGRIRLEVGSGAVDALAAHLGRPGLLAAVTGLVECARGAGLDLGQGVVGDDVLLGPHLSREGTLVLPDAVLVPVGLPEAPDFEASRSEFAAAVEEVRSAVRSSDLPPVVQASLLRFADTLERETPGEPLTPSFARRLVARGWLEQAGLPAAVSERLRRAAAACLERRATEAAEGDGRRLVTLADAFGGRDRFLEGPASGRYTALLAPPACHVEAGPLTLVVELPAGCDPRTGAGRATGVRVHAPDGTLVAWWEGGEFGADLAAWRIFHRPVEGTVSDFLPPHAVVAGLDGEIALLVTAHGAIVPPRSGEPEEVERFLGEAARVLPDPAHLDLVGERLYQYVYDSTDPRRPYLVGSSRAHGDIHQTVAQTLGTSAGGICHGDCDDLAELYRQIAERQGRLGHILSLPAHNALCWAEREEGGAWRAVVLHTGLPFQFTGPELPGVLEAAYDRFTGGEPFDPVSIPVSIRFDGENQRGTWYLGHRIFSDPAYARAMIEVQHDWHRKTYQLAFARIERLVESGDRDPANYAALAGLAEMTGQPRLAARYQVLRLRAEGTPSTEAMVRLLGAFQGAGALEEARDLARALLDDRLPTARNAQGKDYGELALGVASALVASGDEPLLAAELVVGDLGPFVAQYLESIVDWIAQGGDVAAWAVGEDFARARRQVERYTDLVLDLLRHEAFASVLDQATVERLCRPIDQWIARVLFRVPAGNDLAARFAFLGEYARARRGDEFLAALEAAPWPTAETPRDHANRPHGLDALEGDLPWIKISVPHWVEEIGRSWEDRERLDSLLATTERALELSVSLGVETPHQEQTMVATRIYRALGSGDEAGLRALFAEVAAHGDKYLHDCVESAIGQWAAHLDPERFDLVLSLWSEEVDSPSSYFGIAWTAFRSGARERALRVAALAVERFPAEEAFARERDAIAKRLLAGEPEVEIPLLETGERPISGIGTKGAKLRLPPGWKPGRLGPGPKDQFHGPGDSFAMIWEIEAPFLAERDFSDLPMLAVIAERLGARLEPVSFVREGRLGYARTAFRVTVQGMDLHYVVYVVGGDGLAYGLMAWGHAHASLAVDRRAADLVRALEMPGPETEWGRGREPRRREFEAGAHRVSIEHRPAVLGVDAEDATGALLALSDPSDTLSFHVFLGRAAEAAGQVRAAHGAIARYLSGFEPGPIRAIEVAGQPSARGDFTWQGGLAGGTTVAVPLGEGRFLELRLASGVPLADREELLGELLESLRIEAPPELDPYPEAADVPRPGHRSPALRRLLEAARTIGETGAHDSIDLLSDHEVVLCTPWRGVDVLDLESGRSRSLAPLLEARPASAVAHRGAIYFAAHDRSVWRWTERGWTAEPFQADRIASAGERGLLLVRDGSGAGLPGFESDPGFHLLLRDDEGTERTLARFPSGSVTLGPAADRERRRVLVGTVVPQGSRFRRDLSIVDLDSGQVERMDLRLAAETIGPAPGGWLVGGTPADGRTGLYRIEGDGQVELLATGPHLAGWIVSPGAVHLFVALDGPYSPWTVLLVPDDVLAREGPHLCPYHPALFEEIAREAVTPGALRDRPALEHCLAAAAKGVTDRGIDLPLDDPAALEAIRGDVFDRTAGLGEAGRTLLAALFARKLLEAGAEWVDGEPRASGDESLYQLSNLHAVAWSPLRLVDGWSSIEDLVEEAGGRRMLVGPDLAALEARVRALDGGGVEEAADGLDAGGLIAYAREHATNRYLRGRLYDHLAGKGRFEDVAALATSFLGTEEKAFDDELALLAARTELASDRPDERDLVAALRDAIQAHPHRAVFYLLLGRVHERSLSPNARRLARLCYEKVIELEEDTAVASQADAALHQLDE